MLTRDKKILSQQPKTGFWNLWRSLVTEINISKWINTWNS